MEAEAQAVEATNFRRNSDKFLSETEAESGKRVPLPFPL